jgi:hypothetical protein
LVEAAKTGTDDQCVELLGSHNEFLQSTGF